MTVRKQLNRVVFWYKLSTREGNMRRVLMNGVPTLACAVFLLLGRVSAYQKPDPQAFSGTWKLDVAASSNPNGADHPGPMRAPRPTEGAKGSSLRVSVL